MRRVVLGLAVVVLAAVPAGTAQAADPLEGARECVENGVAAVREVLQGTPQPQTCNPL